MQATSVTGFCQGLAMMLSSKTFRASWSIGLAAALVAAVPPGRMARAENIVGGAFAPLSLPKTRFEHSDGVVRQGPDTRQCRRAVRPAVCRAHPSRAKRGSEPHCNRWRISRGFAEGARR